MMTNDHTKSHDDVRQTAFLRATVGVPGSGAVRYAAAMYFHTRAEMSVEMLEIYRTCCNLDGEDPVDLARFKSVNIPAVVMAMMQRQEA